MAPLKLALVAASAAALAPASTPLVSRKLALQEFGIAAAGVLGGATLFAPPAEALTQEEKDALYQEFKAKKERKQDLRRANSYSDKARGENLAGSLPDEDLAAKLADKAGKKQMKSLAREAPGAKKPKDIQGKDTIRTETKSLKELAREGSPQCTNQIPRRASHAIDATPARQRGGAVLWPGDCQHGRVVAEK